MPGGHFRDDFSFVITRNHVLPSKGTAEKNIAYKTPEGEEEEGEHPCDRANRIAVIAKDNDDCDQNRGPIQD